MGIVVPCGIFTDYVGLTMPPSLGFALTVNVNVEICSHCAYTVVLPVTGVFSKKPFRYDRQTYSYLI